MKYQFLLILFLNTSRLFCQIDYVSSDTTIYKLNTKISCDKLSPQDITIQILGSESDSSIIYSPDSKGAFYLPRHYRYLVITNIKGDTYDIRAMRTDNERQFDTLVIPPIYGLTLNNSNNSSKMNYYHCDRICNGYLKSFRENGLLWQEGKFKNGKLKILKDYSADSKLKSIIKNRVFSYSIITYNEVGNIDYKMKIFLFFLKVKTFDENQQKDYSKLTFTRPRRKS